MKAEEACELLGQLFREYRIPVGFDGDETILTRSFGEWAEPQLAKRGLKLVVEKPQVAIRGAQALGTTFWPDGMVEDQDSGLRVSVQIKIAKPGKGQRKTGNRAKALASLIGQAIIDTAIFDATAALFLDLAGEPSESAPESYHEDDARVEEVLRRAHVFLVVRKGGS